MPRHKKAAARKQSKEIEGRTSIPHHEREIRKIYKDPDKLTEVSPADAKVLNKLCGQHPVIFLPDAADHIAYNIIRKKRKISFKAIYRMLRSSKKLFFLNADYPLGYVAGGHPGRDKQEMPTQLYNRSDEQLMVVFDVVFDESTRRRQIVVKTAWSESDPIMD